MELVHNQLATEPKLRVQTVIDTFSRLRRRLSCDSLSAALTRDTGKHLQGS